MAKFDQSKNILPLATISGPLNALCGMIAAGIATLSEMNSINEALGSILGSQTAFLAGVLPSLPKIMPSCVSYSSPGNIDSANSAMSVAVAFQFSQLLSVISSHSKKPITLFLDDLQCKCCTVA